MKLSCRAFVGFCALVAAALLACGCADDTVDLQPRDVEVPKDDATIAFEHEGNLALVPREVIDVAVICDPPKPYEVAFHLLGEALDSSLDKTTVIADASGRAAVRLRAANGAATFSIRASIKNGAAADLRVAVSDQGFGDIRVVPDYNGTRAVDEWHISAVAGTTCADLADTLPEDPLGALVGSEDAPLLIEDAPVGPNLAVFVRAGYYMWGCEDETDLVAGDTTELRVFIVNKPLDLSHTALDCSLAFAPEPDPWEQMLTAATAELLDPFCDGSSQGAALHDWMSQLASDPAAFDAASQSYQWQGAIETFYSDNSIDLCQALSSLAQDGLAAQPPQILGAVQSVGAPGYAMFTIQQVGSINVADLVIPSDYLMSWTADPDDTVRLGGTLFWLPTSYVAAAVEQLALGPYPPQTSFPEVLGELSQCPDIADLLSSSSGWEADPLAQLCIAALQNRWGAAIAAATTADLLGEIPLQASGAAQLDDVAAITGFDGSWVGNVTSGEVSAKVQGPASATSIPAPPTE